MGNIEESSAFKAIREFKDSLVMRAIRDIEESPALRAIRQIQGSSAMRAIQDLENSPVARAMRDIEESPAMRALRQIQESSAFRAIQDLENSPVMRAMRDIEESPFLKAIQAIEDSAAMNVISALADRISSPNAGPLSFVEAYQAVLQSYDRASHTTIMDPLDAVATEVEERVRHSSQGPLGTEFYLNLILALFLFWYSQICSNDSEKRILKRIESMETLVTQQLAELRAYDGSDTFYIVERTVNLRMGLGTKSKTIALLYPNSKVRLIERAAKSIKVEYFDYFEGIHKSGWVYKKYLKIMNPQKHK